MVKLKNFIVPLAAFIGSCLAGLLNYSLLGHEFTLNEILAWAKAMVGIQCQVFYLYSYIQLS